jgi:predicted DsbA family dithiol-disulfide isomerase
VCVERIAGALTGDYAHALYASADLSEAACEALAIERGIDRERYRACLSDGATDARVEQDIARFDAVEGDGVPLLYVGQRRLEGAQSRSTLEVALDRAISEQ